MSIIQNQAYTPERVFEANKEKEVLEHFGILNESLTNGWPYLKIEHCSNCSCGYIVYVAVFEPRNGWIQAVLQGITELMNSSKYS